LVAKVRVAAGSASIAVVLTASLSIVGCGGDNRDDASPPTVGWSGAVTSASAGPPSPRAQAATTPSPQAKTAPSPQAKRGSVVIDWLKKYTPAGGGEPGLPRAYIAFMQGDCEETLAIARSPGGGELGEPVKEPYRSLYEGVAAACLAAFHGRQGLWRTAQARLASTRTGGLDCWELEVYAIFKELVRAHQANSGAVFVRGKKSRSSKCPQLTGLDPEHGSPAGGYPIVVEGRNLPPTLTLRWSADVDSVLTARKGADGVMRLEVPPAESGQDALVVINIPNAPRIDAVYVNFTYDCANGKC
jgi:hypothetical protein